MSKIPIGIIKAIDELFRIRNEQKLLVTAEKEIAETIKLYMLEHGLSTIEAKKAQAEFIMRENRSIDPEAYLEALDGDIDKLLATVNVRMDIDKKTDRAGARSYLGEDELNSISSITEIPILSVKKLDSKPISVSLGNGTKALRAATT